MLGSLGRLPGPRLCLRDDDCSRDRTMLGGLDEHGAQRVLRAYMGDIYPDHKSKLFCRSPTF